MKIYQMDFELNSIILQQFILKATELVKKNQFQHENKTMILFQKYEDLSSF